MAAQPELPDAERLKFFTDAVVAIAMTLLILPLLESVSDAARDGASTADYLHDSGPQLFGFALSFLVIAGFWLSHERLFDTVGSWSTVLVLLNILWMLTIVFLPVATALTGSLETDRPQVAVYVGTMAVSSLTMWAMHVVVRRDPRTWEDGARPAWGGVVAQAVLSALVLLALVLGVLLPAVGYYSLFLLFLTAPLQAVVVRRWPERTAAAHA